MDRQGCVNEVSGFSSGESAAENCDEVVDLIRVVLYLKLQ
jgi:hypothetical protein